MVRAMFVRLSDGGHSMMRLVLLLFLALLGGADRVKAQEKVEVRGITSMIKLDEVIFGHLTELNGKFKMRALVHRTCPLSGVKRT
jgi:hypothetical protein